MPVNRRVIGLTGPSHFTSECMEAIEELFDANFVLLYQSKEENLKHWLDQLDGVIVAGGIDIHPTTYGESIWNNHNLSRFDLKRDFRELAIIEYAMQKGVPLLGICRGHQLLGIRHGLGFIMDVTNSIYCHQPKSANISLQKYEPVHAIKFINKEARERFFRDYKMPDVAPERQTLNKVLGEKGRDRIWVNSFHHQAIAYHEKHPYEERKVQVLGIARVDLGDLAADIIELMQGENWIGVQWHPEYDFRENTASRIVLERFRSMVNREDRG